MGNRRIASVALSLAAAALLLIAGCGDDGGNGGGGNGGNGGNEAGGNPPKTRTIGLSVLTLGNPFFVEIADTITAEAAKSGYEVIVKDSELKVEKQSDQVSDFIAAGVDAIILTPADSRAIGEAIKAANRAGIPVFTCDIASIAKGAKVICHVATDNLQGGRLAAKAIMEALGNKGKIAIVDFPEVESVMMRTRGFMAELKDANSPIEVLVSVVGAGDKDKSFDVTARLLSSQPELDGIFAINDPSALGAYEAVAAAGKQGRIKIVGFDGAPEGKKAILEGKIYADPIQFPKQIAAKVVDALVRHSKGEAVESEILINTSLYRKADAEKEFGPSE